MCLFSLFCFIVTIKLYQKVDDRRKKATELFFMCSYYLDVVLCHVAHHLQQPLFSLIYTIYEVLLSVFFMFSSWIAPNTHIHKVKSMLILRRISSSIIGKLLLAIRGGNHHRPSNSSCPKEMQLIVFFRPIKIPFAGVYKSFFHVYKLCLRGKVSFHDFIHCTKFLLHCIKFIHLEQPF